MAKAGADDRTRTGDLVLTKDALYLLSYIGPPSHCPLLPALWRAGPRSAATHAASSQLLYLQRQDSDATTSLHPASPRRGAGLPAVARRASEGWSGRRGSNPRPTAWKAVTLPLSYSRLRDPPSRTLALRFGGQARLVLPPNTRCMAPTQRFRPVSRRQPCPATNPALPGWPASRSPPPSALLPAVAGEGWWRGEDSNLRSR